MKNLLDTIISKTVILFFLIGLLSNNVSAQEDSSSLEQVITFTLKDGSKVLGYTNSKKNIASFTYPNSSFYSNADFGQTLGKSSLIFFYYDNEGKEKEVALDKIDSVNVTDSSFYFMRLKGEAFFWSKVVENDNYILYDGGGVFKIYDKVNEKFLKIKLCRHSEDGKMYCKKDEQTFEEKIKPYFKDCSEFIDLVNENLKEDKYDITIVGQTGGNKLFKGIANLQCQ
jgi:hypothetical protein